MSMKFYKIVLLSILCISNAIVQAKEHAVGTVISITDGDTVNVKIGNTVEKIRLHGIDAPEKDQPLGAAAKQKLSSVLLDKEVMVIKKRRDQYGRIVAELIRIDTGESANRFLVTNCYAWHAPKYAPKDSQLRIANDNCKKSKKGLWGTKLAPVEPWLWRKK